MAYELNKKYWFKSHAGGSTGKYLNVYGNEQVSDFRNVCLWTKAAGANSQGWIIVQSTGGLKIVTALNQTYGLDFYRGTSNYGNCDIYPEAGNDTDSAVVLEVVNSTTNVYKIRLANHTNIYLTAKGTSDNSDVRWETSNGTTSQQWKLEEWPTPVTKMVSGMYDIYNQKYTNNSDWIKTYGCAVCCCCCNVNSFYKRITYTLAQAKTDSMYNETSGVTWSNVKYADVTTLTTCTSESQYLAIIREQIDLNRPVLVYCTGGSVHWVVAYGYEDGGDSKHKILVLDSYNANTSSQYGVKRTLYESMDVNFDTFTISGLRTTIAK